MTTVRCLLRASLVAATFVAAGCSEPLATHGGLTEDDARRAGLQVAVRERARLDSDLYRVELVVDALEPRAFPSGVEYWDVTLVDPDGIPRVCVRLRSGGRNVSVRRCDPGDAPPPAQPPSEGGTAITA